jgi:hypothetical protein
MVNTFLVDSDYSKSAEQLDSRRLGKQRVEAYQILNLIDNIEILSIESGIQQKSDFQTFVKEIKKWYTSQTFVYILSDKYNPKSELIRSEDKKIKVPDHQRVIKLGFCNHPIVEMWYGYKDALKEYIDAHIKEWCHRGYKNTMHLYDVTSKNHPEWCSWEKFHVNHKGALLKKELDRSEKPWYQLKKDFICVQPFEDYIWVKQKFVKNVISNTINKQNKI